MLLSCGDHSFPLLPHQRVVELIAALELDGINIVLWGGRSHIRPDEVALDVAGWAARLDERVRTHGLEFADIVCIPGLTYDVMAANHPDTSDRQQGEELFERALDLTARLGAPGMTILPGIDWPHETHEESFNRSAAELTKRVSRATDRGVQLSIEAHTTSVCEKPEDALRMFETVPGLTLTLDYSHFVSQGIDEEAGDQLIPYARHVHARGGAAGHLQIGANEDVINHERIVNLLRKAEYDDFIAIEYVWDELMDDVDVISETVLLRDRLRASFMEPQQSDGTIK